MDAVAWARTGSNAALLGLAHAHHGRIADMKATSLAICLITASGLAISVAQAQQTSGTPGAPDATTTIDGRQLPAPDPAFGGVITDDALQSKPWWAPASCRRKARPTSC
jgi:hypothetical protein